MFELEFYISKLISLRIKNELTPEQEQELNAWLVKDVNNALFFERLCNDQQFQRDFSKYLAKDKDSVWKKVMIGLGEPLVISKRPKLKLKTYLSVAAAVIALICTGIWILYPKLFTHSEQNVTVSENIIKPGTFGATLTLSDGKKIRLGGAKKETLAEEAGVIISKSQDGQLLYKINDDGSSEGATNTLSTDYGQTYIVVLPDQTKIWLNSASTLTYHTNFNKGNSREVKLAGEAYFEVSKDKARPFSVMTSNQQIKVLGTHFNVSSYTDDQEEKTTLLEGSIRITAANSAAVLVPGQQGQLVNGRIKVSYVDTDPAVAWKNNEFLFDAEDIEDVMKLIKRWYNVDVIYNGPKPVKRFTGGISRFDMVSKVLDVIESTGAAHFVVKGRTIYVSK